MVEELLPQPEGEILTQAISAVLVNVQDVLNAENHRQMRDRPSIDIPEEQLALLLEHQFQLTDIARLLDVSLRTIRR